MFVNNKKTFLSIIIPCYNEYANLQHGVLDEVYTFLQSLSAFGWEIIVSDDGSTDDSLRLVYDFKKDKDNIIVLENEHQGKPGAVYSGILAAQGEYILFTDMDQSTPIAELAKMLPFFGEYDAIIGSRIDRKNYPLYRQICSKLFVIFRKIIILKDINDTQCGFKAFRTSLARDIFPQLAVLRQSFQAKGWTVTSFDVELLYLTLIQGKKIKEVLVEWSNRDLALDKKKSYLKESAEMFLQVLQIKRNALSGRYKK